jgi:hypothetical protein
MEEFLGVPIGGDGSVPGTVKREGVDYVYFADDGKRTFRKQFKALTGYTNPPYAKSGGATEEGCTISLPDGSMFHAVEYHGDVQGWSKDIEEGARALQVVLARIEGNRIVTSDGKSFALTECEIKFS